MKKIILSSLIFVITMISFIGMVNATNGSSVGEIQFVAMNNTNSKTIENLEVSIYQVSKQDEHGNFVFASGFEGCTLNINDLTESNLENLKNYAKTNTNPLTIKTTNSTGEFVLSDLELGTYLFVQENKTEDIIMQTMLVFVPESNSEDELNYEITAKPKILNKEIVEHNVASNTKIVKDEQLPYTGVLNWPIPVLVVIGIAIFSIAWLKVYSIPKKKVN